ncbi:MAG: DUF4923 family protein [Muribaculaceae bacterium]|jgi:hypothetical protein|nr:DUF4923 family protein [Muribaculaceae bacterium]
MRKSLLFILGAMLMMSASASAQIDLGSLGKVLGQAGGTLSSVLSGKNNVSKESLVGTWSYQQPSMIFESSDLLKQAGGKIASSALEQKLAQQFAKGGIVAGKYMITFTEDGQFTTYKDGNASTSGTYTIDGSKIIFGFVQGTAKVTGYAQFDGDNLSITFDSSKLLSVMGQLGKISSTGTLGTISSLAKSFDGMKTGMLFSKYVAPAVTQTTTTTTTTTKTTTKKSTSKKKTSKKSSKKSSKRK